MAVISDVRTFLLNSSDISTAFGVRIAADELVDKWDYPKAKISLVNEDQLYTQDGAGGREVLLQIDVYDNDRANLAANAYMIKTRLSGYRGVMGDSVCGYAFVSFANTGRLPEKDGVFRKVMEVTIVI